MRVAVWHDLPSGGGRRALVGHLRALRASGHEVLVLAPPAPEGRLPVKVEQTTVPLSSWTDRRTWAPLPPGPVVRPRLRALDRHLALVAEQIARWDADVVFVGCGRNVRVPDLPRLLTVPAVLYAGEPYRWLHEAMPDPAFAAPRRGDLVRRARDVLDVPAWRHALRRETDPARSYDAVLVNSSYSRDSFARSFGVDATVSRLGVDVSFFTPGDVPRHGLLSVGAMVPEKRALQIVQALVRAGCTVPLTWIANVADQAYLDRVRAAARNIHLDVRVGVSDEELRAVYRCAAVFVYAPHLEPFGLAPVEAASSGCPVVAVREGGVRDSVRDGETGVLVDGLDELAVTAIDLANDRAARQELGRRARTWAARECNADRLGADFVALLEGYAR